MYSGDELNKRRFDYMALTESVLIGIASEIPIVGGIVTALTDYLDSTESSNIQEILKDFSQRLAELETRVDRDFIVSQESAQLIESVVRKGRGETRAEKRTMLTTFLASGMLLGNSTDKEKFMVLDVIDRTSEIHVLILKEITEGLIRTHGIESVLLNSVTKENSRSGYTYVSDIEILTRGYQDHNSHDVEASLDFMVSLGILETNGQRVLVQTGDETNARGFRPSKLGLKVLNYLDISINDMSV